MADKDKKRDLDSLVDGTESLRVAVEHGVPREEAVDVFRRANEKVEKGEWVEVYREESRFSKSVNMPQSTSIIRYWGPPELQGLSRASAERLFAKGELGKTHEVVRGSSKYSQNPEYKPDISDKLSRKLSEKYERLHGRAISIFRPSYPASGQTLHRHWEIEDMYRYEHKRRLNIEGKIAVFLFVLLAGIVVYALGSGVGITGYSIADFGGIGAMAFVIGICLAALCLILLRKKVLSH